MNKTLLTQFVTTLKFVKVWINMLRQGRWASNEVFLTAVYRAYLGRDPDDSGKKFFLPVLSNGAAGRIRVLKDVATSLEFRQRHHLKISPIHALHKARMMLVQSHLPPAEVIVDLGGASNGEPCGALLVMGYPYTPKQIIIIDLPLEQRLGEWNTALESATLVTPAGTQVHYLYRSLADLTPIADASVDMVFSGESIEHVSETDANKAIQEAYRVLKPGGHFCLDTPNRALTILHSPHELIHPEHQKEYLVEELMSKVKQYGFEITAAKSVCPMPQSLASGAFDWEELVYNSTVSDNPATGYLFFLQCHKPK